MKTTKWLMKPKKLSEKQKALLLPHVQAVARGVAAIKEAEKRIEVILGLKLSHPEAAREFLREEVTLRDVQDYLDNCVET